MAGTGDSGRITKKDVEAAIAAGTGKAKPAAAQGNPFLGGARPAVTDIPMSPMRQVIGSRLLQSKTQLPHFYCTEKIDVTNLVALRGQLNAVDGVKVSFNDLVTKATALNLVRFHA